MGHKAEIGGCAPAHGPLKAPLHAPVAQLDRASDYESEGRAFESLRVHHSSPALSLDRREEAFSDSLELAGGKVAGAIGFRAHACRMSRNSFASRAAPSAR